MAKINLLPWRAERRKQRQNEFFTLLGLCAGSAMLLAFGAVQYFDGLISNQQDRNGLLEREIVALKVKTAEIVALEKKKSDLLARKTVIEQLQANRSQMVHLFDDLVRTLPDGVRLNSVKQTGNALTLEGMTQSNARVSSYMRNIEAAGWMSKADLGVIEIKGEDKSMPYFFRMNAVATKPVGETEEGENIEADEAAGGAAGGTP
jgi:type IV pilus assembly protein PilN